MRGWARAEDHAIMLPPAGAQSQAPPTILIVDDEPLLAEFLVSIAQEAGWSAEPATSAGDFEAKIEQFRPDTLVLDLAMPGRDGVELVRQLAANNFAGSLIIVSACDHAVVESSAMLAREHGLTVAGYLQKPVAAADLASLLDEARANLASKFSPR